MAKTIKKSSVKTPAAGSGPLPADFIQSFQILIDNNEFMFKFMDLFPFPIEVFAPDGLSLFVNKAMLNFTNVTDPNLIVGNYNVLKDPVMEQMGQKANIQKAFNGEPTVSYDVIPPIDDLVRRGVVEEKPFEKAYTDWYLYPIMDGKKLAFVVFVCPVKKVYHDRSDLAQIKRYLDTHWKEEYNAETVAAAANMSVAQLYKLFKQHTGMPPMEYYKRCKVEHIKEKLQDKTLSIKEAFAACGEDSHNGAFIKVFKKLTGLSPIEYRKQTGNG